MIHLIFLTADVLTWWLVECQNFRLYKLDSQVDVFNTVNAKLNPICHLLALVGAHHILHVSRIRVNRAKGTAFTNTHFSFLQKVMFSGVHWNAASIWYLPLICCSFWLDVYCKVCLVGRGVAVHAIKVPVFLCSVCYLRRLTFIPPPFVHIPVVGTFNYLS